MIKEENNRLSTGNLNLMNHFLQGGRGLTERLSTRDDMNTRILVTYAGILQLPAMRGY